MADEKKPPAPPRKGADGDRQTGLVLDERVRTKKPPMYKVLLHNDDYTTREFVCELLTGSFGYTADSAEVRMMEVHTTGRGVLQRLTAEAARPAIKAARELARSRGYPLWIGTEPT